MRAEIKAGELQATMAGGMSATPERVAIAVHGRTLLP